MMFGLIFFGQPDIGDEAARGASWSDDYGGDRVTAKTTVELYRLIGSDREGRELGCPIQQVGPLDPSVIFSAEVGGLNLSVQSAKIIAVFIELIL